MVVFFPVLCGNGTKHILLPEKANVQEKGLSHLNAWDDIHRLNGKNGKDIPFSVVKIIIYEILAINIGSKFSGL
jgi:hypothetical protein